MLTVLLLVVGGSRTWAQDNVRGGVEPIDSTIDPATLTYDYLVDGDLLKDDPANRQFRTLQAAYEAAPSGTEENPTVIGIRPNVYLLPGGPARTPSMRITKDNITFLGLTRNRRAVVLADNRGNQQGAEDNGYILDVDADGFTCRNLTLINYCNVDYEYPGDPSKNLTKRSNVITQAVALQAVGDRHVYENVALLGRLDTMFLRTRRSYFKNVYIEGTDDWLGGGQVSVWQDCTLVFPEGQGVMIAVNIAFFNCRFEATDGMRFYKVGFRSHLRPSALIDCTVPVNASRKRVAWMKEPAPARASFYSLTHNVRDTQGDLTKIYDSAVGEPTFDHSRELSKQELEAFNPWNLLRAVPGEEPDDWDPAGMREKYEAAGQGALVYRIGLKDGATPNDSRASLSGRSRQKNTFSIRTGGSSATIGAWVTPSYAADPTITWSSQSDLVELDRTTGPVVVVTGRNTTEQGEWVAVNAKAVNGFYVTAGVSVEPAYIAPPAVTTKPTLTQRSNGTVGLDYELDLDGRQDQSLVRWMICDDAAGANGRAVAVSRGNEPLKTLVLTSGYVGKYVKSSLAPKHPISEPGAAVTVVSARPVAASDIATSVVSPNFRHFVETPNDSFVNNMWTVSENWRIETGENLENGYGIHSTNPARLFYQRDADTGDMQVGLLMRPDKTAGQVFSVPGSPADEGTRNLHADIYIKYDPRTGNGYSLRFWRTTQSSRKCMFQFFKIVVGAGTPLDDQQMLTGIFKREMQLTLKVTGTKLTATASNTSDDETLQLASTIAANHFGGTGMSWSRGSSAICSRFAISYP
jgi:hypothetical protein